MKNLKRIFYALFAAVLFVGCSDQLPDPDDPAKLKGDDGEGVFMALDILMPNADGNGRSQTVTGGGSSSGVEVGSDAENIVTNALVILAQRNTHAFIAAGEVQANRITASSSVTTPTYKAIAKISKTNLNSFYETVPEGVEPIVEVYVFCNPTKALIQEMARTAFGNTEWVDMKARVIQGNPVDPNYNIGIWSPSAFLMNNTAIVTRALPKNLLDWESFDKVENPFHLSDNNKTEDNQELPDNSGSVGRGSIRVERSVARFDFKDGSDNNDQVYNVLFQADPDDPSNPEKQNPLVAVKLQRMCLVNMSNSFYFLPRVSDNGQNYQIKDDGTSNNWALCGNEKPWFRNADGHYEAGNYVVGPNAAVFAMDESTEPITSNFYNYFNYPFFDNNGTFNNGIEASEQWDVYRIPDVLAGDHMDNYNGKSEYHVWRYVTENVIPYPRDSQVNGITTGVVFRGRLQGTQFALDGKVNEETWEEAVYKNLALCLDGKPFELRRQPHAAITGVDDNGVSHDPILYYFDGKLYFTWEHIRQAAIQASVTPTYGADGQITSVEINRSNIIYQVVFGDGPIPDGQKYVEDGKTGQANAREFTDPRWDPNPESAQYKLYQASTDYAWRQWVDAGEYVGTISGADPEKIKPLAHMREVMTEAGVAIYQTSLATEGTPGYYCYYYYWNRHNDNGIAGVMGPMEFDVVRNNVYKLSVNKISRLGHPRIPENDPENPTPETPDESANIYIDVTVEVAPWVARINEIMF